MSDEMAGSIEGGQDAGQDPPIEEAPLRYFLARRMIGVPTWTLYLRTIRGLWLLAPPLLARALGRVAADRSLHAVERWWARRVIQQLGIHLDLDGLDQIDPGQTYIVTPLHEGFADVLAVLHLPLNLRFAARDELFSWRTLGPYLRDTRQIFVAPEQGSRSYREIVRVAPRIFAVGDSLVIFPQGTILGIESDFMPGAFALARAVQRPILPIVLTGSHRVWEHPYSPRLRYGQRISMRVLPPIPPQHIRDYGVEALRIEVRRQLKALALSDAVAAPRRFVPERDGYWDGFAYRIDPDFPELAATIARHRQQREAAGP